MINTLFHNNGSPTGGGLSLQNSNVEITNTTVGVSNPWSTSIAIYSEGSDVTINNSVILGNIWASSINNTINYNNTISKYGFPAAGSTSNAVLEEMDVINPGMGNYVPSSCSPYLNYGNNSYNTLPTDIYGNPRIVGDGIDLGAIELQHMWTNDRVYVDASSTNPFQDGATWETAFTNLNDALSCGCNENGTISPAEVWVAAGTYTPDTSFEGPYSRYKLNKNQKVYGGFSSGATSLEDRDLSFETNQTILSGHVQGTEYIYNIVAAQNMSSDTELNGFIIQDGRAFDPNNLITSGAAISIIGGQLTLKNLWIRNNSNNYGGTIWIYSAGAIMENIKLTDNTAGSTGAGIYFQESDDAEYAAPTFITNIEASGNVAAGAGGGGIYISRNYNVSIDKFKFKNNTGNILGGAIFIDRADLNLSRGVFEYNGGTADNPETNTGGAIYIQGTPGDLSYVTIESVLFNNNNAILAGALYISHSFLNIINCTFAGNRATGNANTFSFEGSNISIKNSIITGVENGLSNVTMYPPLPSISPYRHIYRSMVTSDFAAWFNLNDNVQLNVDPQFVDAENGNYNLVACGPAVDAGINSFLTLNQDLDAVDNRRIKNLFVDLGALEFQYLDINVLQQPLDVVTIVGEQVQFTVEANAEDINYQWQVSTDNGVTWINIPDANAETLTIVPVTANMHNNLYRCVLSSCSSAGLSSSASLVISGIAGINDMSSAGYKIFPNPGNSHFTIKSESALTGAELIVYDVHGRYIYNRPVLAEELQHGAAVNCEAWASGLYWVHIKGDLQGVIKFVKE